MKKLLPIFLLLFLFPSFVFAKEQPLGPNMFYLNNQSSVPFTFNLASNGTTNVLAHLYGTGSYDTLYDPGSYLYFTVISNGPIEIKRKNDIGVNCSTSCFGNDVYLQLIDDTNGYQYLFYFKISKINWNYGTQTWQYSVDDEFSIINKSSSTNSIYIFGTYMEDQNPVPSIIANSQVQQSITIMGEKYEQATQDIIDSSLVCTRYDMANIETDNRYLQSDGTMNSSNNYGITNYIKIDKNTKIRVLTSLNSDSAKYCFYDINKNLISCHSISNSLVGTILDIPTSAEYFRSSIQKVQNKPTFDICRNGNQSNNDALNDINNNINSLNGETSQTSIDGFGDFFDDFQDPLPSSVSDVLLAPLTLVGSLSDTCNPVTLNVLGKPIELPCGTTLFWERNFSDSSKTSTVNTFRNIWNVLFGGSIIYALLMKLWSVYESLIDPMSDAKIENYKVTKFPKYKNWRNS